ncbi:MAG TPA: hypothetical protein VG205_01010 [Acidimicrobiales bacterium]|jgi:hypothetical protein|nr:hypothetical protein [Acidimicrobiales bacterium]
MEHSVTRDPIQVVGRLDEMGLKPDVLAAAVTEGCAIVRDCTLNDPAQLAGILGWGKITRAFRDRHVPLGWTRKSVRSQATTVSPDGRMSIVIAGGDENTGIGGDTAPTTKSAKGPATKDAVASNQRSFGEINSEFARAAEDAVHRTWILLYYIDEESEEIRVELSLPSYIQENGYVYEWREQIVIPPISLSRPQPPSIEEQGDDEEIDVKRRVAN